MSDEARYWDSMADHGRDASVIDPRDRRGRKNAYIVGLRNDMLLRELAALPRAASVLDFGCGTGNITRFLRAQGYYTAGVDISSALLEIGRKTSEPDTSPFFVFDGKRLPLRDGAMDAAITYVVLNHILDEGQLAAVLRELHRILRPGGRLIAIEQINRVDSYDASRHSRRRTLASFLHLFEQAGFALQHHQTVRFGHFPTIYLVRCGLLPAKAHRIIAAAERLLGRVHPIPWFDYADVLFVLTKPA